MLALESTKKNLQTLGGSQLSGLQPVVYVLDDDDIILWMFQEILQSISVECRLYQTAQDFLRNYKPGPCECLISDMRMPEIGGLEVQRQLLAKGPALPIIFVSGYAEISTAVEALKHGAFDFLEKPVNGALLVEKVQAALTKSRELHAKRQEQATREARLALLTDKERQVCGLVVAGQSSKEIAETLELSARTVENHRARIMEKLHVGSTVDLVKLFL
jgi:two-component system response regulator FixJ